MGICAKYVYARLDPISTESPSSCLANVVLKKTPIRFEPLFTICPISNSRMRRLRHTREITMRETPDQYVGQAREIISACNNLNYIK